MAATDKFHYLPKSSELLKNISFESQDDLFAENKAAPVTPERIQLYKKHLQSGLEALIKQFHKGTSITQLLKARSALADHILVTSWLEFGVEQECALIAVGGYGREELQPYSDIDILILLYGKEASTARLESWLTFLWDLGLEVGHSVRTIEQCRELALEDISVATNLMEARQLSGNKTLFQQLQTLTSEEDFWPALEFFQAKVTEQRYRHAKFKDSSFNLEPNIKSTPGGLRDLHVMQWVSLKHFKNNSLHNLIGQGVFTRREYKKLLSHQQFLNKVRFALHAISNKREDRLIFEQQKVVAEWLGFEDQENSLAVEQLMQRYYRAVMAIRNLNDLFVQIFEQEQLPTEQSKSESIIDEDFCIINQRIGARDPELFNKKPSALISIFKHLALDPEIKQIQAQTVRKIRASQQLINHEFRQNPENIKALKQFFASRQLTSRGFALMKRTNILGALIPLFAKIEGQMQFDLFHAYTVDEHTLFLLRHIIRYNKAQYSHEFPICSKIMSGLEDQTPIYLAAVFHDIAKGRGGDHSELGAQDAREFCQSFDLPEQDCELIAWLVENHLIMSMTAQRKDISDPTVIANFCQRINNQKQLDLLYVLTVSDIRATNPTLWNSWKESLLKELYLASTHYLKQATPNSEQSEIVRDTQQQLQELAKQKSIPVENLEQHIKRFDEDYLLRYHPEQILWHLDSLQLNQLPSVAIKHHRSQAGTEVVIAINDKANVFAAITACLSQQNLNIQAATLYTSAERLCIDTFIVLEQNGQPLSDQARIAEIKQSLESKLSDLANCSLQVTRAMPSRFKHFNVPTGIRFIQDEQGFTLLELSALDRPALLANIGQAFIEANIRLHAAKIVTLGEKVEDTFKISKANNQPISDPNEQALIKQRILELIDS